MAQQTPAYLDCVMPSNCDCAARGYPIEGHTKCVRPAVEKAAKELGITMLPRGQLAATPFGTVWVLAGGPDLAQDVVDAIDAVGAADLATGNRVGAWLVLTRTPAGDAVYWNIAIGGRVRPLMAVSVANRQSRDWFLETLRELAGGPSTDAYDSAAEPPTIDELHQAEQL